MSTVHPKSEFGFIAIYETTVNCIPTYNITMRVLASIKNYAIRNCLKNLNFMMQPSCHMHLWHVSQCSIPSTALFLSFPATVLFPNTCTIKTICPGSSVGGGGDWRTNERETRSQSISLYLFHFFLSFSSKDFFIVPRQRATALNTAARLYGFAGLFLALSFSPPCLSLSFQPLLYIP